MIDPFAANPINKNVVAIKRISNEISCMLSNEPFLIIDVKYTDTSIYVTIDNAIFILDKSYPFVKPKLLINNIDYFCESLSTKSLEINRILHQKKINCLCCKHLLNNWTPCYTLKHILEEVVRLNKIKREVKYELFVQRIIETKMKVNSGLLGRVIMQYLV
jgi:hypothetical protein